jgi:hypothetical protein
MVEKEDVPPGELQVGDVAVLARRGGQETENVAAELRKAAEEKVTSRSGRAGGIHIRRAFSDRTSRATSFRSVTSIP